SIDILRSDDGSRGIACLDDPLLRPGVHIDQAEARLSGRSDILDAQIHGVGIRTGRIGEEITPDQCLVGHAGQRLDARVRPIVVDDGPVDGHLTEGVDPALTGAGAATGVRVPVVEEEAARIGVEGFANLGKCHYVWVVIVYYREADPETGLILRVDGVALA